MLMKQLTRKILKMRIDIRKGGEVPNAGAFPLSFAKRKEYDMNRKSFIAGFASGLIVGAGFASYKLVKFAFTHDEISEGIQDYIANKFSEIMFKK